MTEQHHHITNALFHDVFKSVLNYHYDGVIRAVRTIIKSRVFDDLYLSEVRQEQYVGSKKKGNYYEHKPAGFIDCVWIFDQNHKTMGWRQNIYRIFHEVKTGKIEPDIIVRKYNKKYFRGTDRVMGQNSQFWIWGWLHHINNIQIYDEETQKLYDRGVLKIIPLEFIFKIARRELEGCGFPYQGDDITFPTPTILRKFRSDAE